MSERHHPLPPGWAEAELGDVTTAYIEQNGPGAEGEFTYIDIGSVDNLTKVIAAPKILPNSKAPSRARQNIRESDVLVSMTRPNLNAVALVPRDLDGAVASTGFLVLRPIHIEPEWIFAQVRSPAFIATMSRLVQGALYPAVRPDDIRSYRIPIPPLAEQIRIVRRVNQAHQSAQDLRSLLGSIPRLLDSLRRSSLAAAFRGDLTADWRAQNPDVEPAPMLMDAAEAEHQQLLFVDPRRELPSTWTWASIAHLSRVVRGASPRPAGDPRFFNGSDTPWITVGELTKDTEIYLTSTTTFLTAEGKKRSRYIEAGTLLLTNSGATLGVPKITRIGGCINDGSVALLDVSEMLQMYLYFYLSSLTQDLRGINQGAAQPNLNTDLVRGIAVPLPPQDEQVEIVRLLLRTEASIKSVRKRVTELLERLTFLDSTILTKAVLGELVPQDPDDEPASVLLERIRAERAGGAAARPRRGRRAAAKP